MVFYNCSRVHEDRYKRKQVEENQCIHCKISPSRSLKKDVIYRNKPWPTQEQVLRQLCIVKLLEVASDLKKALSLKN